MSEQPRPDPNADDGRDRPDAPPPAGGPPAAEVRDPAGGPPAAEAPARDRRPRPVVERVGMAAIALVMAVLFALVGAAAFIGGEPFLGVMGVCGCLMVLWVGGISALRG